MSAKRNKPSPRQGKPTQPGKPGTAPVEQRIPLDPPMLDRKLKWWPLVAILLFFLAWLIWLAFLAIHSDRWKAT